MKAHRPDAPAWYRRLAEAGHRGLVASSPAYELHAPRHLRLRALALALVAALWKLMSLGRIHA